MRRGTYRYVGKIVRNSSGGSIFEFRIDDYLFSKLAYIFSMYGVMYGAVESNYRILYFSILLSILFFIIVIRKELKDDK